MTDAHTLPSFDDDTEQGPPPPRLGSVLVVLAVVAVAALLLTITLPDRPDRPSPEASETPTVEPPPAETYVRTDALRLVNRAGSFVLCAGVTDEGAVAVVWSSADRSASVLAIDRPDGSAYVASLREPIRSLTPAPGGLLAVSDDLDRLARLRADSSLDPLAVSDEVVEPAPGDVAVDLGDGPRLLRSEDGVVYRMPTLPRGLDARSGYVAPDGTLTVSFSGSAGTARQIAGLAVREREEWTTSTLAEGPRALPGLVAGRDATVAVTTTDVGGDLEGLYVSEAGGEFRTVEVAPDLSASPLTSLVVAPSGTVLAGTRNGTLLSAPPDGSLAPLPDAPASALLLAGGDRVWAVPLDPGGPLSRSEDGGLTWATLPLPGREKSPPPWVTGEEEVDPSTGG